MTETPNFCIATTYGKFLIYLLYHHHLGCTMGVQTRHPEISTPSVVPCWRRSAEHQGISVLGGFQDPATQSHGCPYLLSPTAQLQGFQGERVFSTHCNDPVILFLQRTDQTPAAPTSQKSPVVTTEAAQTPQTWP